MAAADDDASLVHPHCSWPRLTSFQHKSGAHMIGSERLEFSDLARHVIDQSSSVCRPSVCEAVRGFCTGTCSRRRRLE